MHCRFFYILSISLLALACQNRVVETQRPRLSEDNKSDKAIQTKAVASPELVLDKNKEIDINESFVNQNSLSVNSFVIKKSSGKKI